MTIHGEQELEAVLARPSARDVAAFKELAGDIIILGVAGKMGPSLARRARRASDEAGASRRIIGVARFSEAGVREQLERDGIETIAADLLDGESLSKLPDAPNVVFMAGRKFGSTGSEELTWAMNTYLPALVAERYRDAKIVAFSSGNIYPFTPIATGGPTETHPPAPVGEYAQSVLGRERMFQYCSKRFGTKCALLRLNYAIDLRYGVLLDIGRKVFERRAVDVTMGAVNVIWQGDANSVTLRSFAICSSPPAILNLTGPETLSVRWIARQFGQRFGVEPVIEGNEAPTALLNNASHCQAVFGYPEVSVEQMIDWIAEWIRQGGSSWAKPTHFETRDGKF
jgi:nucleoside-diphosphate-sugar epimerase